VARVYDHVSGEYYEVTTEEDVREPEEVEEPESEEVEEEPYICGECGREFDTKRGLSMHKTQVH